MDEINETTAGKIDQSQRVDDDDDDASDDNIVSFDLSHLVHTTPDTEVAQLLGQPTQQSSNGDEDDDDDNDNDDESQASSTKSLQLSPEDLHVQMVLKSRRKENNSIKFRRDLLFSFVLGPSCRKCLQDFYHPKMATNAALISLNKDVIGCRVRKHDTKKDFIGDCLFHLWKFLQESDELYKDDRSRRATSSNVQPLPIKNLRAFINKILTRFKFESVNSTDKKQRSITAKNKVGDFIQDEVLQDNPKWMEDIRPTPCPLCNHNAIIPHENENDIRKETAELQSQYKAETSAYYSLTPANQKKNKPPKMPSFPKQHMICMCLVNRCVDFSTGRGCINCQAAIKCGMKLSFDPHTGQSKCPMCMCTCTAYFEKMKWTKIRAQSDVDKQKAMHDDKMTRAAGKCY